jgi:hypothetical protein
MSHHYSGPNLGFPHGDARLDMTDLYVFTNPQDEGKSILALNVHPSFNLAAPGQTRRDPFAANAVYEFKIDTNGDAIADIAYRIVFSPFSEQVQAATLRRAEGAEAAGIGDSRLVIIEQAPVSLGKHARIAIAGDHRLFVGWRSDPFFFDPIGAVNNFQFTGADYFADKDIRSIVLEVPNAVLGSNAVTIWARTVDGSGGTWIQAERGARPSQSIFLTGEAQSSYLAAEPQHDAEFIGIFAHSLEHTGGYTPEEANGVATTLLPDVLPFDHRRPVSYPDNGRKLTDDVLDHFVSVLTNGRVTTDGIAAHTDLLDEFPYLGPPHQAPR